MCALVYLNLNPNSLMRLKMSAGNKKWQFHVGSIAFFHFYRELATFIQFLSCSVYNTHLRQSLSNTLQRSPCYGKLHWCYAFMQCNFCLDTFSCYLVMLMIATWLVPRGYCVHFYPHCPSYKCVLCCGAQEPSAFFGPSCAYYSHYCLKYSPWRNYGHFLHDS